jgi:hypothetical protein
VILFAIFLSQPLPWIIHQWREWSVFLQLGCLVGDFRSLEGPFVVSSGKRSAGEWKKTKLRRRVVRVPLF